MYSLAYFDHPLLLHVIRVPFLQEEQLVQLLLVLLVLLYFHYFLLVNNLPQNLSLIFHHFQSFYFEFLNCHFQPIHFDHYFHFIHLYFHSHFINWNSDNFPKNHLSLEQVTMIRNHILYNIVESRKFLHIRFLSF